MTSKYSVRPRSLLQRRAIPAATAPREPGPRPASRRMTGSPTWWRGRALVPGGADGGLGGWEEGGVAAGGRGERPCCTGREPCSAPQHEFAPRHIGAGKADVRPRRDGSNDDQIVADHPRVLDHQD